jgi:hypothetical protein
MFEFNLNASHSNDTRQLLYLQFIQQIPAFAVDQESIYQLEFNYSRFECRICLNRRNRANLVGCQFANFSPGNDSVVKVWVTVFQPQGRIAVGIGPVFGSNLVFERFINQDALSDLRFFCFTAIEEIKV